MGHSRTKVVDALQQVSQPFDFDTKMMHSIDRIMRSIRSSLKSFEASLEAFVGEAMPRECRALGMSNRTFDQLGKLPLPFGAATPTLSQCGEQRLKFFTSLSQSPQLGMPFHLAESLHRHVQIPSFIRGAADTAQAAFPSSSISLGQHRADKVKRGGRTPSRDSQLMNQLDITWNLPIKSPQSPADSPQRMVDHHGRKSDYLAGWLSTGIMHQNLDLGEGTHESRANSQPTCGTSATLIPGDWDGNPDEPEIKNLHLCGGSKA